MPLQTYALGILAALAVLLYILYLLRNEKLREKHASLWIFAALIALFFSVYPNLLYHLSDLVGIDIPSNLMFFISIAVLFLVAIQTSSEITTLEEKTRVLAERIALLEMKVQKISKSNKKD